MPNTYPVHIHYCPNELTDDDVRIIQTYCKRDFEECWIAKVVDPITKKPYLHGGGVSTKQVGTVSTELHQKLGFMKDTSQT